MLVDFWAKSTGLETLPVEMVSDWCFAKPVHVFSKPLVQGAVFSVFRVFGKIHWLNNHGGDPTKGKNTS